MDEYNFTFTPIDQGLHVQCSCGNEQLLQTTCLTRPVYCSGCGLISFVPKNLINSLQASLFKMASERAKS